MCQVTYLHAEEKEYSGSSEASEVEDQDDPESPLPLSISEPHLHPLFSDLNHMHTRHTHTCIRLTRVVVAFTKGLSKAETQALTNYGSGEDENEEEEMDEFESGPVEVQTSLQAAAGLGEQPVRPRCPNGPSSQHK